MVTVLTKGGLQSVGTAQQIGGAFFRSRSKKQTSSTSTSSSRRGGGSLSSAQERAIAIRQQELEAQRIQNERQEKRQQQQAQDRQTFISRSGQRIEVVQNDNQVAQTLGVRARGFGRTDLKVRPRTTVGTVVQEKTGGIETPRKVIQTGETVQKGFTSFVSPVTKPVRQELVKGQEAFSVLSDKQSTPTGKILVSGLGNQVSQVGEGSAFVIKEVEQRPFPTFVQTFSLTGFKSVRPKTFTRVERTLLSKARSTSLGTFSETKGGEVIIKSVSSRSVGGVSQVTKAESVLSPTNRIVTEKLTSTFFKGGKPINTFTGTARSRPIGLGELKTSGGKTFGELKLFEDVVNIGGKKSISLSTVRTQTGSVFGKETVAGISSILKESFRPVTSKGGKSLLFFEKRARVSLSNPFLLTRQGKSTPQIQVVSSGGSFTTPTQTLKTQSLKSAGVIQSQVSKAEQLTFATLPKPTKTFVPIAPLPKEQTLQTTDKVLTTSRSQTSAPSLKSSQQLRSSFSSGSLKASTLNTRATTRRQSNSRAVTQKLGTDTKTTFRNPPQKDTVTSKLQLRGGTPRVPTPIAPTEIIGGGFPRFKPRGLTRPRPTRATLEFKSNGGFKTLGIFSTRREAVRTGARIARREKGLQSFKVTGFGSLGTPKGFTQSAKGIFKEKRKRKR